MRIERFGKDASGKDCSEGFYATDGRAVYLMPPTGEMAKGLRLATQAEIDRGPVVAAAVEQIANCIADPSDLPVAAPER